MFIFDHTIRRAAEDTRNGTTTLRGPGKRVHIDQSYRASEARVKYHLPDEADELLKNRFQIINVCQQHLPLPSQKQTQLLIITFAGLAAHQDYSQRSPCTC